MLSTRTKLHLTLFAMAGSLFAILYARALDAAVAAWMARAGW